MLWSIAMYKPIWKLKIVYAADDWHEKPYEAAYITEEEPNLEQQLSAPSITYIELLQGTVAWDEATVVKKIRGWVDV